MSEIEARKRFAEAICGASSAGKLFPWRTLDREQRNAWHHMVDAGFDALKADGYALVKLREPDDAEVDAQEWATSSALCARRFLGATGDPHRIYVWDKAHAWDHGADPITPYQARELASALLSAAAAAEEVDPS